MIGHECRLSRANTGGIVWVCECGEVGDVVPLIASTKQVTARSQRRVEITESIARARHGGHLHDVRADIEARSERVLASIPRLIDASNATLQRRGRWGHP